MTAQPIVGGEQGIDAEQFRMIFRGHPAGVAVVTLQDGGRAYGFTATSVISVSAEPPLFAFSVHKASSSWSALSRVRRVMINFLAEDQADVAARFATSGIDRFAGRRLASAADRRAGAGGLRRLDRGPSAVPRPRRGQPADHRSGSSRLEFRPIPTHLSRPHLPPLGCPGDLNLATPALPDIVSTTPNAPIHCR
ncbi:MAG: flavin reductase family protein [Micropruina sp.]